MAFRTEWRAYVPQHQRRAEATRAGRTAASKGEAWTPVRPTERGRKIARTVWGLAWCDNLERYHDYANRLPRGRTYIRNGSVVHLEIGAGKVLAQVVGSSMYRVEIAIAPLPAPRWRTITGSCARGVASMIELLEGRLSADVMAVMTARGTGLFPEPREIELRCSCPDWATMCKHVAAVMYGVGVRLDEAPQLLFALRGVDASELVALAGAAAIVGDAGNASAFSDDALSSIFGIELADAPVGGAASRAKRPGRRKAGGAKAVGDTTAVAAKPGRAKAAVREPGNAARAGGSSRRVITRGELLALGLSAGTISGWFDRGVLEGAGRAGVYRWTRELERRLAGRGVARVG